MAKAKKSDESEKDDKPVKELDPVKVKQMMAEKLTKESGGEVYYVGGQVKMKNIEWLDSGSPMINLMLSGDINCGYPRGRIVELIGAESGGKTTLAIMAIIERQKTHPEEMFGIIDAEHAFNLSYNKQLGLKDENLFVSQPDNGEQGLSVAESMIENGFSIVVIDSIAALTPTKEIEGDMGDPTMANQARLINQAMRKLTGIVNKNNTVLILINQWREKIGVTFGSPRTPVGGNAIKFFASMRIDITRGTQLKHKEVVYGNTMKLNLFKSKVSTPFSKTEVNLIYGQGFDMVSEYVSIAKDMDIIKNAGSWFSYGDTKLGQGFDNVCEIVRDNPELLEEIKSKIEQSC